MTDIPDIEAALALVDEIKATHPGKGRYNPMDRYRDFRAVFLGSDQGKRVLCEIMSMASIFVSAPVLGRFEPNRTMFFGGAHSLAYSIASVANTEPAQPQQKQRKERE